MAYEEKQQLRQDFLENGFDAYVFFTLSGKETNLAKWDEESVLIKGYVFIYVPKNYDIRYIRSDNNPYKILKWQIELGKLFGDDLAYAEWVLQQDGLIGVSKAIKVNQKVKIVDGPLAELEGYIVKYDPRNRNCLVELHFMNREIKTWLPFEYTDQNYKMD